MDKILTLAFFGQNWSFQSFRLEDIFPGTKPIHKYSPGIVSCIRAGVNTGATCIRTEMNSLKNLANMRKMIPQEYFPVFAQVRIQAPHVFAHKFIPQDFYPVCIRFVPGGHKTTTKPEPQRTDT